MNRLIRLWNQNRKECIIGIVIFIAIIIIIQVLNAFYARQSKETGKKEMVQINSVEDVKNVSIEKDTTQEITGSSEVSKKTEEQNVTVMKHFIQYCNEKDAEAAYNLLTKESKEILFPTLEDFAQDYVQEYFQSSRGLDYELWTTKGNTYTYKITLVNDALAEGSLNTGNSYKDYFTVVAQDGYWKLNVGGLIKYQDIDKTTEQQGLIWKVTGKEIYKDYEIYTLKVSNRSGKTIMLDPQLESKSIFSTGDNNTTYTAFTHEIPRGNLILKDYGSSTLRIKFNKIYNKIDTTKITFSQIVKDYDSYVQNGQTQDFAKVEISIE